MARPVNKVSGVVLLAFVGLAVGIVAVPRGDYRSKGLTASASTALSAASVVESAAPAVDAAPSASVTAEPDGELAPVDAAADVPDAAELALAASSAPAVTKAPKSLTFGVVLVTYAGAQGAPGNARSKADAERLAKELAELAKTDFRAAVKKGDPGSNDDAGKMYQGILEPGPEYALFSLAPDKVSDVVDTPRGFWIVRRIK